MIWWIVKSRTRVDYPDDYCLLPTVSLCQKVKMSTKRDSPSCYSYKDMSCYKAQGCEGERQWGKVWEEKRKGKVKTNLQIAGTQPSRRSEVYHDLRGPVWSGPAFHSNFIPNHSSCTHSHQKGLTSILPVGQYTKALPYLECSTPQLPMGSESSPFRPLFRDLPFLPRINEHFLAHLCLSSNAALISSTALITTRHITVCIDICLLSVCCPLDSGTI